VSDMDTARSVICRIATQRGLKPPWPDPQVTLPDWLACEDMGGWGAEELGAMRERLLDAESGRRAAQGSWYTPDGVALPLSRMSIDLAIDKIIKPREPHEVLRVTAYDPACGCGIYLVAAARHIASRWLGLIGADLSGRDRERGIAMLLPDVMRECVYGVDRDPVAVEIARAVLWLAVGGAEPVTFMDRNVITGNTLDGDEPPALTARHGTGNRRCA
jgi:hypothetical protein